MKSHIIKGNLVYSLKQASVSFCTVFLGHLVTPNGITCDPDKIQDKNELKSFLGLTGYYRKMVPEYSELAIPFTRLTKKKVKFHLGPE